MVSMADEFTNLHVENYDEESEIFGCNRCSLIMSIFEDRLSSFFSELTNKTKQVEVRLEGLDVLALSVEEMKGFLKAKLDRLDTWVPFYLGGKKNKRDLQRFSKGGHEPTVGKSKRCVYDYNKQHTTRHCNSLHSRLGC